MRLEMVVDPPGEHSRFHRRAPRVWQRFHPDVQVQARGCERSFGIHLATAVLHAITDLPLVNIQPDVIHRFHGGASFGVSESASAEFSFSTPSAPPSTYTFRLIVTDRLEMDHFRFADKPTGRYVDERGLSPSGGIRDLLRIGLSG